VSCGHAAVTHMLPEPEAAELLSTWGIPYVEHGLAADVEAAVDAAASIGYPVVLKVVSRDVIHKTDVGGVILDIRDEAALRVAHAEMLASVLSSAGDADINGVLVNRYVSTERELIVGALRDSTFGPAIMVGLGGVFAEVLSDVSFRVAPLATVDGLEMIRDLRGAKLLSEFRGRPSVDLLVVAELLVRVGALLLAEPSIQEIDLNPVAVFEDACVVLDARVVVAVEGSPC
jgi:succinyl-CoA synthetase beta subunit